MKTKTKLLLVALTALLLFSCTKERLINEPGNLVPKTVDQDPTLPSITVNGVMLHSEAFGHPDSTMIVALHGGPGCDYREVFNCKDLADHGYRVVFYDQRGSGLSQRLPKQSYTSMGSGAIDAIVDELHGVIAHYRTAGSQRVILLGQSWGAMLATAYAGKHPQELHGLIVVEPGGLKWDDVMEYSKAARTFNPFGEALNDVTYIDQFLTNKNGDQHAILDYKMAMQAADNEVTGEINTEPGSFWRFGAVISQAFTQLGIKYKPDFSAGISAFKTPVLFFYSEQNRAYPDSWAQKISGAYPAAHLYKVKGTGHSGILDNKQTWSQITLPRILEHINSL